ncbi:MAG: PaaI family thioesterase [Deltaproteobacteria bacterium]|nr:PaaI family thioesterase [Deltaproteobacteria bacterium]
MDKIKRFFSENDQFAKLSGIELLEVSPGGAKTKMKIEKQHLNGVWVVHGGAVFTLADFTFAVASNSHGKIAVAVNVSISFLKAAREGYLFAEAKEISRGHKLSNYQVEVKDEKGDLVAMFQGMAYQKKGDLLDCAKPT